VHVALIDPVSYTLPYDHSLAAGLARRGLAVDLLTASFAYPQPRTQDGYRVEEVFFTRGARLLRRTPRSRARILLKGLEYVPSVRRLLRRIAALDPEVVHLQWLGIPQYDRRWVARLAHERAVVFTAHDVLPRRTEARVDLWRSIFATVDRIVVHGEQATEQLAELGVPRERVARIPHALFEAQTGVSLRPPGGSTLLFFGLIRASKGLDLLLRALPAVAEGAPDVRLIVAGDPLEPVEPLRRLAAELGVAERVEWRLAYVPEEEIPALMDEATIVVLPYRKIESSGVLATALGHGRPAVVADIGSLGDVVRAYGAGLVFTPEDPHALAAACLRLLRDEEALAAAFRGTEAARAELTWDAAARAHEELYRSILEARR
jgi:glycosyltransferase involved in cell wall biosynthesis